MAIKVRLLSDEQMRNIGFTDFVADRWYYHKMFKYEVSFNIRINKYNSNDFFIYVLDEDFCQPYDYQYILSLHPDAEVANEVRVFVEKQIEKLQFAGIIYDYVPGEYI